jgi:hypothetical protein
MTGTSISDVKREFCGKQFTLRASQEAWAQVELELKESHLTVFSRILNEVPRQTDLTATFAALALPHGKHSGRSIRAIMPVMDGGKSMKQLAEAIKDAWIAASPKDGDVEAQDDEGDTAGTKAADPQ